MFVAHLGAAGHTELCLWNPAGGLCWWYSPNSFCMRYAPFGGGGGGGIAIMLMLTGVSWLGELSESLSGCGDGVGASVK